MNVVTSYNQALTDKQSHKGSSSESAKVCSTPDNNQSSSTESAEEQVNGIGSEYIL